METYPKFLSNTGTVQIGRGGRYIHKNLWKHVGQSKICFVSADLHFMWISQKFLKQQLNSDKAWQLLGHLKFVVVPPWNYSSQYKESVDRA